MCITSFCHYDFFSSAEGKQEEYGRGRNGVEVCSGRDNLSLLWPVLGAGNMIQREMRFPKDVAGQDSLAGDSKQEVEILRDDVEKVTRSR